MRWLALVFIGLLGGLFFYRAAAPVPKKSSGTKSPQVPDYLNFDFEQLLSGGSNMNNKPYEQAGGKPIPRGIANNNPLNIRENHEVDYDWQGEHDLDLDPAFEEFISPWHGIRAAARILKTYRHKRGLKNVHQIIYRWAPPSDDNPTEKYIEFVANSAGVDAQQTLSIADYPAVVAAMIHFENGYNPYDDKTITEAVTAGLS
ncbi:hypothetical protein [Shewanella gelidii]|uniref:Structural protein P5 n=1 Tax=Shewanella gelidii TaxID=1642821 RepID=A0A917JUG3_9GAMM|nr:hypothetical protein [Shewanella gelidii]MCL1098073.1 hypothetical protein [Shewanella gelidii]GGI85925.1 hypothetical protein GCM10009332_24060 [Shewanella gelidii]